MSVVSNGQTISECNKVLTQEFPHLSLLVAGTSIGRSSSCICNYIRATKLISKSLNCFEYGGHDKMKKVPSPPSDGAHGDFL